MVLMFLCCPFGSLMEAGIQKKWPVAGGMSGMHLTAMHPMDFVGLKGLDFK